MKKVRIRVAGLKVAVQVLGLRVEGCKDSGFRGLVVAGICSSEALIRRGFLKVIERFSIKGSWYGFVFFTGLYRLVWKAS